MEYIKSQILEVIKQQQSIGIALNTTINPEFEGRTVDIDFGKLVNFSLSDYLGLSTDIRIRKAAAEACMNYGAATAMSRTYFKLKVYEEAEDLMSSIFEKPCLIVPKSTLCHIAALPVLVEKEDAVILDHQVHATANLGAQIAAYQGCTVDVIRHNRIDLLEAKIIELSKSHSKIWYLADSVYSMYGDTIPADDVMDLLHKYSNFYLYVDDAHGMSWAGEHGKGYFLSKARFHPRMMLITSLGKGFGSGGGLIVCPNDSIREKIEILGTPLMFSTAVAPATLGAIVASAKIHLSEEVYELQYQLRQRVKRIMKGAYNLELPIVGNDITPVIYVATGKPDVTGIMCRNMMQKGYYVTGGIFPAVPYNNSGLRILLNNHLSFDDIDKMLETLRDEYFTTLGAKEQKVEDITKLYKHMEFFSGKIAS